MSRLKKLPTVWFQDCKTPEEKKQLEAHIFNSTNYVTLVKLKQLLTKRLEDLDDKETNVKVFDDPNWSHKQAHYNGQRETIKWMLDLLAFVK